MATGNPACPGCAGDTELVGWEQSYGFACQGCRGHFIRSNAINAFLTKHDTAHRFLEHLEQTRESPASRRSLKCPDCGAHSYRVIRTELLEYDACSQCGSLYLDPEEAARYFEHVRNAPPPRRHPRTFAAREKMNEEIITLMCNLFF
jgi:Zn-finger nucleic acid-binding protein